MRETVFLCVYVNNFIDLPVEALAPLLHLIFLTISRYQDRESRKAIVEALKELNNWNPEVFQKTIIPVIVREAEKCGKRKPTGYNSTMIN